MKIFEYAATFDSDFDGCHCDSNCSSDQADGRECSDGS